MIKNEGKTHACLVTFYVRNTGMVIIWVRERRDEAVLLKNTIGFRDLPFFVH